MQFKKLATALSISLASLTAVADDYLGEVGLRYIDIDSTDGIGVFGELHFSQVSTSGHPLEEAGYLEKSSNVNLSYTDYDGSDLTQIQVELYLSNFYVAPGYIDSSEGDGFGLVALGYASDGLRITTTVPEEDYEANVQVKYVTGVGAGNFINVEGSFVDGGDFDDILTVGADFYFDETLSVGGSVINSEDTDFQLRVNKFFTGSFRAGASFQSGDLYDTFAVEASLRF